MDSPAEVPLFGTSGLSSERPLGIRPSTLGASRERGRRRLPELRPSRCRLAKAQDKLARQWPSFGHARLVRSRTPKFTSRLTPLPPLVRVAVASTALMD